MNKFIFILQLISFHMILGQLDSSYVPIKYVQLRMQNDLFQVFFRSDKNFTNGIHFIMYHPTYNNKIANSVLWGLKKNTFNDFGISLDQDIYTPENISKIEVDSTDRPYNALLYVTYKKNSSQFLKGRKTLTQLFFGVSGKAAVGGRVQNYVHKITGSEEAKGWDNQVGSGLMIDYALLYKQLLPFSLPYLESNFIGQARAGTIRNYISAGLQWKFGYFGDSYHNPNGYYQKTAKNYMNQENYKHLSKAKLQLIPKKRRKKPVKEQIDYINNRLKRKVQVFANISIDASYYFYDGTISGSLIQFKKSGYTIPAADYNKIFINAHYGLHFQYARFQFSYNRTLQNEELHINELFGVGEFVLTYIFY